jgi:hypothetical protein
MKKTLTLLTLLALATGFSGCISLKTQHTIEPIKITVDINLRTERALDDFFGDLYSDPATETE